MTEFVDPNEIYCLAQAAEYGLHAAACAKAGIESGAYMFAVAAAHKAMFLLDREEKISA